MNDSSDRSGPRIFHGDRDLPAELLGLKGVVRAARDAGIHLTTVATPAATGERRALAKRRHDLRAALRTLAFAAEALTEGYRFDDEVGPDKIQAVVRAVQVMDREAKLLLTILDDP